MSPKRLPNPRPIPLDETAIRVDAERIVAELHVYAEDEIRARKSDGVPVDWPLPSSSHNALAVFEVPLTALAITGDRRLASVARITLSERPKSRLVIVGGSASIWRGTTKKPLKPEGRITLVINARYSPVELSQMTAGGIYTPAFEQTLRVLRHELTHVGDWKIEQGPSYVSDRGGRIAEDDWAGYYNDPLEVRAFLREVVDDVVHYTNLHADDRVRPRRWGDFVESALESSQVWQAMRHKLTPENEKLFLKAAYRAVEDAVGPARERRKKIRALEERMRQAQQREAPLPPERLENPAKRICHVKPPVQVDLHEAWRADGAFQITIDVTGDEALATLQAVGTPGGAFFVTDAWAEESWGPFVYDLMIERTSELGLGLLPDWSEVSPEARSVWRFYARKRKDVDRRRPSEGVLLPGGQHRYVPLFAEAKHITRKRPTTLSALARKGCVTYALGRKSGAFSARPVL